MKKPIVLLVIGFGLGLLAVAAFDVIKFRYFDTGSMPMGVLKDE